MAPPTASSSANTTSVQVAVRIRPSNAHDVASIPTRFQRTVVHGTPATATVTIDPSSVPSSSSSAPSASTSSASSNPLAKKQTFTFDQVHPQETYQHAIYASTAAPLVARFLQGFNCTILAYGQTSSGKTYTMTGVDLDADPSDETNGMGIVPRSVATVFASIQQLKQERGNAWNCSLKGSFIEIYNEDLIDLLAAEDSRRDVQIREEKDGTILWSGLKEVNVRNTGEVMNLIKQGSSIRRTNETDMNAQSSRSHAIFSLTLTQKKYTGSGTPRANNANGRTSPMPPTPSPSRLARPASVYTATGRVGSPTFGRPPTPSFASAMRSAGSSLRPASAMALRPGTPDQDEGSDGGAWVTVVSKFHFVDLAGSERLKRTAAVGERIKEGISINSGLLALGNVISALGDPSRSRSLGVGTAVHVPYRDSKLTRLLQDSLGGNSHTLMIACVSPAEWNAAETVNTLKYANRARNIKNRAEVKEKEEGWDDLEWLQGMVLKLRKEMKAFKEGGGVVTANGVPSEDATGASAKMLQKYHELQGMHEELRVRFSQANAELRRTKEELDYRPIMSPTSSQDKVTSIRRYEEIVAPVIEQYEKTISAMEAELKLNRTALAHTNEMYEEQETELEALKERHSTTELYVEELRARVSKLVERESSTESYVRDLEQKLKTFTESSASSSESLTDLRKEIARYKETESATATYISKLEARLARSDADVVSLREMVEKLENDLDNRSNDVKRLEAKLDAALSSNNQLSDLEGWKAVLEERERKVQELEKQMEEWQRVRAETGVERRRLGAVVEDQEKMLEREQTLTRSTSLASVAEAAEGNGMMPPVLRVATTTPTRSTHALPGADEIPLPPSPAGSAESPEDALLDLRETHSRTLADLSSVTSKYRDALREISDLAAQISEAKLHQPSLSQGGYGSSGEPTSDVDSAATPVSRNGARASLQGSPVSAGGALTRRRRTLARGLTDGGSGPSPIATPGGSGQGKRLFFRHAASSESLHSRSQSQSLSQELSLARSPASAWLAGDSLLSPTLGPTRSPVRMSLQLPGEQKRSVDSLEKEIMRLQEVLKERESEIGLLEKSLDAYERSRRNASPSFRTSSDILEEHEDEAKEESSPATTASDKDVPTRALSPGARQRFLKLQKSLDGSEPDLSVESNESPEDSLTRLNELMRSMAQKESQHKETVDDLNSQLEKVRRQHDELTTLNRDQAVNMSAELEALRGQLSTSHSAHGEIARQVEELRQREHALLDARQAADDSHTPEIAALKAEHDVELERVRKEHADLLARISEEHEDAVQYATAKARREAEVAAASQLEASIAALAAENEMAVAKVTQLHESDLRKHEMQVETLLARTRADHERAITRIRSEHEESLRGREVETTTVRDAKRASEDLSSQYEATIKRMEDAHQQELLQAASASQDHLNRMHTEHDDELKALATSHDELLRSRQEEHAVALRKVQEDQETALARVRTQHDEAMARKVAEFELMIQRMRDDHAAEMRQVEIALEGSMSESQVVTSNAIKQLQEEHGAALDRRDVSSREDLENLKVEHERVLGVKEAEHQELLEKIKSEHTAGLVVITNNATQKVKDLEAALSSARQEQGAAATGIQEDLSRVQAEAESARGRLVAEHEQMVSQIKADHQIAMTEAQAALITAGESHHAALEETRAEHTRVLAEEQERHVRALTDLETLHSSERDTLRKAHDLLADEVASQRNALGQAHVDREQDRQLHQTNVDDLKTRLTTMEEHLQSVMTERAAFASGVEELRGELEAAKGEAAALRQETTRPESLSLELERYRSAIGDLQSDLQRTKDEKDNLMSEKQRQEVTIQGLQAQLAGKAHRRDGSGDSAPNTLSAVGPRLNRANGKLPPLTPPPSVPPPPLPTSFPVDASMSSHTTRTSGSSHGSRAATPDDQSTPSTSVMMSPLQAIDPKIAGLIEEQAKHLEEQETMIKTLNKQLTHCEADLQAHMDLVATLESSLTDSERNLRKARMQANDLAKERDSFKQQMSGLRQQITEAQQEASNVRRSVAQEKQNLESRLADERKAKERVRAQLDSRMEEMNKKPNRFVCM